MTTVRVQDHGAPESAFPLVRRGYDCATVDQFTRDVQNQVRALQRRIDLLEVENHRLSTAQEQAQPASNGVQADFASLGGRAQEILRIAEEQARDTTHTAYAESDALLARSHHDADRLRDETAREMAAVREGELGELALLRRRGEEDAVLQVERATVEAEQLLSAARLQAEAVRVESETRAQGLLEAVQLEVAARVSAAEQQASEIARTVAEQQASTYADLHAAQQSANTTIQSMLAEATAQQSASAEHVTTETEQATVIRREALAEAERTRLVAVAEAEQIVARAQKQAVTIDERARQEFNWRRRQMRQEQDLLIRRKQAMMSQLTSLSALAAETAGSMPDVPELAFPEYDDELPIDGPATSVPAPAIEQFAGGSRAADEDDIVDAEVETGGPDDETAVRQYTNTRRRRANAS